MMKRLLTFLFAFILAIGVGWAETDTWTAAQSDGLTSGTSFSGDNISWTASQTATQWVGGSSLYYRWGSNSSPATVTFTGTGLSGTITGIAVEGASNSSRTVNVSATVGGQAFGSSATWTSQTNTTLNFSGSASGTIVITLDGTTNSTGVRLKSITVTYSNGGTTTVAAPTITPSTTGTVDDALETAQTISMSTTTSGASIYYTTDGTTPSATNGTEYTGPFTLSQSATVKAIAILNGTSSSVTSQTYYIRVPVTFTFSPASGTSLDAGAQNITVTLSDATHDWRVYYTTNGDDPTGSDVDTYYSTSNGTVTIPVTITAGTTTTLWVAAYRTDDPTGSSTYVYYFGDASATYTGNSVTPTPSGGSTIYQKVTNEDQIVLGAKYIIVYESGPKALSGYVSTGGLGTSVTIINNQVDIADKDIIEFTYGGSATAASFLGSDGNYIVPANKDLDYSTTANTSWIISSDNAGYYLKTSSYTLRYNTSVSDSNGPFRCYSSATGSIAYLYTQVASGPTVTATPEGGEVEYGTTVTLTSTPQDATIHYTTDGTEPTASSPTYSAPIAITGDMTIKAMAVSGEETGEVSTWEYTVYPLAVSLSPASGAYLLNTTVGITPTASHAYGTTTVTWTASNGQSGTWTGGTINLTSATAGTVTLTVTATDAAGRTATATGSYTFAETLISVNAPVLSPLAGQTYYGDQTVTMYTTNKSSNVRIYYTIDGSEPTNASTPYDPANPPVLPATGTYTVRAIAYLGSYASDVTTGTYTISNTSSGDLANIGEMNSVPESDFSGTTRYLDNPVQVVFMGTYENDGLHPEYAYVRDNTGYGLIYFARYWYYNTYPEGSIGQSYNFQNGATIFQMGDWINNVQGPIQKWNNGFHPEMGGSRKTYTMSTWPGSALGNTPLVPEETTNALIAEGDTTTNNNLWAHYVHLRKNTLSKVRQHNASGNDFKMEGVITDQSGYNLEYYDKFCKFSNYGTNGYGYVNGTSSTWGTKAGDYTTPYYNQAYFDAIQNAGGTFDVYGMVDYYNAIDKEYFETNSYFQIAPFDFLYIYKPTFSLDGGTYNGTQTVTISCQNVDWTTEVPTIYYKTSDMEDYVVYNGQTITVSSTTTIEAYAELPTQYNDYIESLTSTATYVIEGAPEAPVISPESQVKEVGESVAYTVTTTTVASDVYTRYTTDGSDPRYGTQFGPGTTTPTVGNTVTENTTVRAISFRVINGTDTLWSPEATLRTYTFTTSNGIVYDLIKTWPANAEDYVFVIVNQESSMGLSVNETISGNYTRRSGTGVLFTDNTKEKVYGNNELAQFTLRQDGNNWYFHTANGNVTGYLCVGNVAGIFTESAIDGEGNALATVNIDPTTYQATISFDYQGTTTRYVRYYDNSNWFSAYTTMTNEPVYLYGIQASPLATIEREFTPSATNQVTVADELIGVWAVDNGDTHLLWAKDQGNASIDKTAKTDGQLDYILDKTALMGEKTDWDQSNWVMLKLPFSAADYVNKYIKPATITGFYTDGNNYTIELPAGLTALQTNTHTVAPKYGDEFTAATGDYNAYITSNFMTGYLNGKYGEGYTYTNTNTGVTTDIFMMNPKIQEVAWIDFAIWNGEQFVTPEPAAGVNNYHMDGGFNVNWTYNYLSSANEFGMPTLTTDQGYHFHAAVMRTADTSYGPARRISAKDNATIASEFIIYPLDLAGSGNITGLDNITGKVTREVQSVTYYNVAGMQSDRPFDGINIVVTRYTDGSTATRKVMK